MEVYQSKKNYFSIQTNTAAPRNSGRIWGKKWDEHISRSKRQKVVIVGKKG